MRHQRRILLALVVSTTALAVNCAPSADARARDSANSVMNTPRVDLTGAGATFPYPLYARWFNEYAPLSNVRINYLSVGSGAGITAVIDRTVDFGATDVPMSDEELRSARTRVLHVPTAIGAVALTYRLPGLTRPLRLSGDVIADLFLGRITRWNDARLIALNPQQSLPPLAVKIVHRADGSGTSYIFSDYLAAVSPAWANGPGRGRIIDWPVGTAGTGNEGVASQVKATEGAVGYVEVVYARQNRLPVAHVRNTAGRFVSPMPFEIATAATAVLASADTAVPPGDIGFRRSLVNAPGELAYPITAFTWLLVSPEVLGPEKTGRLRAFLSWALIDAVDITSSLGYVPLPSGVAEQVLERLEQATEGAPSRTLRKAPMNPYGSLR